MTPESSPIPAPFNAGVDAFHASFQRGRRQVLFLVALTGAFYLVDTLHGYFTGGNPSRLTDLLSGWAVVGFICWCVYRGGSFASGCLIVISAPFLLGLLMVMAGTTFEVLVPLSHFSFGVNGFHDLGRDWKSTLSFLPVGGWAAYACWVLLVSKDARLYMRLRRREITEREALAFEWKREHRRQERPSDAS